MFNHLKKIEYFSRYSYSLKAVETRGLSAPKNSTLSLELLREGSKISNNKWLLTIKSRAEAISSSM
ncbi:MAG: hypothetical protein PUC14_05530 [Bacteroidales bacterium]|nr:hypothetical protein [Bacteroidales bacterium]